MSTPDRPLTRRQLKEMRRTGQLPVVTPEDQTESPVADEESVADEQQAQDAPVAPDAADATETASDPAESEETPAEPEQPEQPVEGPAEPPAPLTRRELRMQRLQTSQLNVVSPAEDEPAEEESDEPSRATGANRLPVGFEGTSTKTVARDEAPEAPADEDASYAETAEVVLDDDIVTPRAEAPAEEEPQTVEVVAVEEPAESSEDDAAVDEDGRPKVGASFGAAVFQQAEERQRQEREEAEREAAARREAREREEAERDAEASPVVPDAAASATDSRPAPSAPRGSDEATTRGDTGEVIAEAFQRSHDSSGSTAGNAAALILKDMPGVAALNAPITATGELILTSSHTLPEGFGFERSRERDHRRQGRRRGADRRRAAHALVPVADRGLQRREHVEGAGRGHPSASA